MLLYIKIKIERLKFMKNSKYKKVLALVLSSSFIMPCHAGKPQYIQNPNTGLQVRRALPSSEETNNRTQKHIKKAATMILFCGL